MDSPFLRDGFSQSKPFKIDELSRECQEEIRQMDKKRCYDVGKSAYQHGL